MLVCDIMRPSGRREFQQSGAVKTLTFCVSGNDRMRERLRFRMGGRSRRKLLRRVLRPVRWGNLRRYEPISAKFGFDRGTPIDRYYLTQFVREWAHLIRGVVGEVSEPIYAALGGEAVSRLEVLDVDPSNPRATLFADLSVDGGLPGRHFDCLIVTQTLQYIRDPGAALRGLAAALKPGGSLILAVPALAPHDDIEDADGDYWRFWPAGLRTLIDRAAPNARFTIRSYGNVLSAMAFLYGISAEELRGSELDSHDARYPVVVCAVLEFPECG